MVFLLFDWEIQILRYLVEEVNFSGMMLIGDVGSLKWMAF